MVVTPLIYLYDHPAPSMVVRPVVRFAVAWEGSVLPSVVNTTMATHYLERVFGKSEVMCKARAQQSPSATLSLTKVGQRGPNGGRIALQPKRWPRS